MNPELTIRRPLLVRHARYRWDELRRQHQLVFPEGILVLNDSGAAIVRHCDGRSLEELLAALVEQYADYRGAGCQPALGVGDETARLATCPTLEEVSAFLGRLAQKGLLRDADP